MRLSRLHGMTRDRTRSDPIPGGSRRKGVLRACTRARGATPISSIPPTHPRRGKLDGNLCPSIPHAHLTEQVLQLKIFVSFLYPHWRRRFIRLKVWKKIKVTRNTSPPALSSIPVSTYLLPRCRQTEFLDLARIFQFPSFVHSYFPFTLSWSGTAL